MQSVKQEQESSQSMPPVQVLVLVHSTVQGPSLQAIGPSHDPPPVHSTRQLDAAEQSTPMRQESVAMHSTLHATPGGQTTGAALQGALTSEVLQEMWQMFSSSQKPQVVGHAKASDGALSGAFGSASGAFGSASKVGPPLSTHQPFSQLRPAPQSAGVSQA